MSGEERTAPGRDQLRRKIGLCPGGDTTRPTAEGQREPGTAEQDTCVWDRAGPRGPRPPAPGPAPRPRAGREEAERWGPAPRSHRPGAGRRRYELSPGNLGPQGGERGATGGAGFAAAGLGPRKGRGVAPEHALGRRCAAGEGAGAAGHLGHTWAEPEARGRGSTRTGPLDRVCGPLGLSSDKTPKGCLGHGSPEVGVC